MSCQIFKYLLVPDEKLKTLKDYPHNGHFLEHLGTTPLNWNCIWKLNLLIWRLKYSSFSVFWAKSCNRSKTSRITNGFPVKMRTFVNITGIAGFNRSLLNINIGLRADRAKYSSLHLVQEKSCERPKASRKTDASQTEMITFPENPFSLIEIFWTWKFELLANRAKTSSFCLSQVRPIKETIHNLFSTNLTKTWAQFHFSTALSRELSGPRFFSGKLNGAL